VHCGDALSRDLPARGRVQFRNTRAESEEGHTASGSETSTPSILKIRAQGALRVSPDGGRVTKLRTTSRELTWVPTPRGRPAEELPSGGSTG
jgi:hypothetical protein